MDILIRMLMAVLKDRKHKKQRRVLSTVLAAVVVFMTTYSLILPAITLEESTAETTDGIFLESADVSEADPADDDVDPSGELLLTDDAREESAPASDGWEDGLIEDADWEENGELADIPDEPALTDTGDETEEAAETETGNVYAETEEATEDTTESEESVGEGETESELEEQYPEVEFSDSTQYTQVKVYAPEGAFPEGTQMLLSDVEDDETIAAICDAALAENSLVQKVHAVDISFRNSRNEEIEPLLPIRVEMTAEKCAEVGSSSVSSSVVHVDDSGNATIVENAQKVEAEAEDEKDADKLEDVETIAFEAKEFSVYALVYTVDFETIDGGVYSIPGGSSIALSDLLRAIGLDISVEDIKNVEFSDPALLEVSKVAEDTFIEIAGENGEIEGGTTYVVYAGDWLLTSLKAFSTSETLTVTVSDGTKYVINVTDAQLTSDLSGLLTAVSIEIDGQQVEDGSSITVEQGQRFDVHLEFTENDFLQMDRTTLTYTLPEGITLGDSAFSKKVDVSLGQDGILRNNTLQYDPVSNTLNFTWNKRDPRYSRMLAADNTQLIFDVTGQFTSDATHVEFENGYDVTVEQTERKEADVTKNGQVYFPGDPDNPFDVPAIKYTVTVNSTGKTTVNVVDTVEGSAVTLQTTKSDNNGADGGWTATSSKGTQGTQITPTFTGKGFTLNNQTLQDGEEVTITYWGKVNTSGIENLTNVSYEQTGNKVRVTGEGIPDKEVTHFEHEVGKNKLNKSATGVEEVDENGLQIVHWKIVLNDPPLESIGGTTLTDRIASASLQYMDYNTTGIHVVAKTASGGEKMNQNVSWTDPSLTLTQSNDDKHWVYNIPQTDEALIYEITYDTIVDTKKYNNGNGGYFSVVNESEGKPGKGTGTATVGKPEGDTPPPDITYSKKAVDVNEKTITWNIPVNVKAGEYTPFTVEDKIPTMTYGSSIGYTDDIESITVNGLEGDEWYATSYLYNNTNDAYAATGNNVKPSHVILTFYKDGAVAGDVDNSNEQNSTAHPGLKATSDRIINIQIVTKNNQDWLELGREHYKEPATTDHTNTIKVNEFDTESDTAKPLKKSVMKLRDGNHNVSGSGEATAFKKVSTPGTEESPHGVVENNSQIKYPAYKFWVLVGGITDSNLENGNQIIITDVFNENLRLMIDQGVEADKAPMVYGTSDTGSKGTPLQLDPSESQTFTWSQSDGQATFTLTNPPKNGDTYYPYYLVEYWLVPKSEENLASIRELAMESDGTALLENTATSDNISDELDFTYDYSVIDKRSERVPGDTALDKYTIEINKDMLTLNNGVMMELTDTYSSNLSIDFGTIEVTAEQKNGNGTTTEYLDTETGTYKPIKNLITWDFRQNVGTFTIPDATHVTITYYARPIGAPGSIQTVTNTAYMEGYYDTETQDRMVDMSGKGSAEVVRIRLLKFGADHMESGLNGAVFRLLDQDKNPLKNFTTAETGYVTRYGTLHAGHDPLDYDTNDQDEYVAPVQMYQLTQAAQDAITAGTKKLKITEDDFGETETWDEYIAENPDALVTYEDIAENYLSSLGISKQSGFVEVMLDQDKDGMALKKERVYYLQEIIAPPGYEIDTTLYSFLITDQADYSAPEGVYIYHNNDILTVRDWPEESPTLKLQKTFSGNVDLTDEQKNAVTFTIQKKVDDNWTDYEIPVWRDGSKTDVSSFTYGDYGVNEDTSVEPTAYSQGDLLFKNGVMVLENLPIGEYRVIETNQTMTGAGGDAYARKTEYLVDGSVARVNDEAITYDSETGEETRITDNEENGVIFNFDGTSSHIVSITNTYYTNKYTITKTAADTGEVLSGAKFAIYEKTQNSETLVKENIETGENGKLEIKKNQNIWDETVSFREDVLYYVVETEAPAGFLTPEEPDKYFFYFSSENSTFDPHPLLPAGDTAADLSKGFGSALIPNKRDTQKTFFDVKKKWVNGQGQDITDNMTDSEAVTVKLMRTTSKPTAGKAITVVDLDEVEADLSNLHTLTLINSADGKSSNVYFLQGDKLQILVQGTNLKGEQSVSNPNTNPYNALTKTVDSDELMNWTLTAPNSDLTVTVNSEKVSSLYVANITAANRSFILTEEEAEGLNGALVASETLNTGNSWEHTFSNLPVTDDSGNLYFYYITEPETTANSTSIGISGKEITVTNTAPDQLEVNKKWEDSEGNNVTPEKTDGSITYELYQVENPLPYGSYTGDGSLSVDFSSFKGWEYWHEVDMPVTGHTSGIKVGSKVQIVISGNSSSLEDYSTDAHPALTISGGNLVSDEISRTTPRTRTIILEDVNDTITIDGTINIDNDKPSISVTVLEEPNDASTEWDNLVKRKMGEVEVTYDDATLTKESAFSESKVRVSPGTKPWSSLIYNLDTEGTGTGTNAGQKVNYGYYVVEKNSPVASNYDPATYQVDGENVSIANGEPGDTIVIINKEKHIPKVTVEGTKVWEILSGTVPSDPTLTLKRRSSGSPEETVNDGSNRPLQPVWSGEGNTRTFTYSDLPKYDNDNNEYTYTVTEASFKINEVTYTVTENEGVYTATPDDPSASPFVVAISVSEGRTTITNTEKKEFEFKKLWKSADGTSYDTWVKDIVVELYRKQKGSDPSNNDPKISTITASKVGETVTATGVPTISITVEAPAVGSESLGYSFKITGLDAVDADNKEYEYYVKEQEVGEYNASYADSNGNIIVDGTYASAGGQIINTPVIAVSLPSTGGPGTRFYYTLGIAFIAMAGIILFIKRKEMRSLRGEVVIPGDED